MLRLSVCLCMGLIASASFATKPCHSRINRSCLKLKNHDVQSAKILCGGLHKVEALSHSSGSTQLDLSYGDGLGAPDPRQLNCQVVYADGKERSFSFYNPYWGSIIEFDLQSEKRLNVNITSGWSSSTTHYPINW